MANETIKVLLMVCLLGGIRTAMFVSEVTEAQWRMLSQTYLDWLAAFAWPTATSGEHSHVPI